MLARVIGIVTCHIHRANVRGRKFFHSRCISWSYRNRGYDARTHRKEMVRSKVFIAKFVEYNSGMIGL